MLIRGHMVACINREVFFEAVTLSIFINYHMLRNEQYIDICYVCKVTADFHQAVTDRVPYPTFFIHKFYSVISNNIMTEK